MYKKKIYKNKLFPYNGDADIWNKVMIDDETISYISTPNDADKITKIIEKHCIDNKLIPNTLNITDATAGAGGNVLSFCKKFKHVNAIEIDVKRYNFLVNNLEAYNYKNASTFCDDCHKFIYNKENQDIVFFDPPWGGKDYKNKINIRLSIGNIAVEDICINLLKTENMYSPKIVSIKLPKNYDLLYLYKKISDEVSHVKVFLYSLNKMNIIVLENISHSINQLNINKLNINQLDTNHLDNQLVPHVKQNIVVTS